MSALITGGSGQVGQALQHCLPGASAPSSSEFDLNQPETLYDKLAVYAPSAVVNCAAYTDVEAAEDDPKAFVINAAAPAEIARYCADHKIPLVHISTDYVFAGNGATPYKEDDPIAPLNAYGQSKWEGEAAIRTTCPQHVILRTAWVYSATGKNFVKTMLRLSKERDHLKIVNDQRGAPTSAADLAHTIGKILKNPHTFGTFHYTGAPETTWHAFATTFLTEFYDGALPCTIEAVSSAAFPTKARRPHYSVLDCRKIEAAYGITPQNWASSVAEVLAALKIQEAA